MPEPEPRVTYLAKGDGPVLLPAAVDANVFYGVWLRSLPARLVVAVVAFALMAGMGCRVIRDTMAAGHALQPVAAQLQQAIALTPDVAEYHNQLGEIYLYSFSNYDPPLAVPSFERAVALNPHVAAYWLNLARAYESTGHREKGIQAIKTARQYDPRSPSLAWAVGNAYAVDGSVPQALAVWRDAIEGDPATYATLAIEVSWKLAPNTKTQLDNLIPATNEMDFRFLQFLLRNHAGEPDLVWRRIVQRGRPFDPALAGSYLDSMIFSRKEPAGRREDNATAIRAWKELLSTALPAREPEAGNLIFNPRFEDEMLGIGFDWRWPVASGVSMLFDGVVTHGGRRSLRIDFDGTQNLNLQPLYQVVPVEPGRHYVLTGFLRAEHISSSSGPRLQVISAFDSRGTDVNVQGKELFDTNGWQEEKLEFTAPSACYQVMVGILRQASNRFSPEIRGSVWIDDLKMATTDR